MQFSCNHHENGSKLIFLWNDINLFDGCLKLFSSLIKEAFQQHDYCIIYIIVFHMGDFLIKWHSVDFDV